MDDQTNKLPDEFVQRFCEIIPDQKLEQCLRSFSDAKRTSFRVNTLLASTEGVVAQLKDQQIPVHPISWLDCGFSVDSAYREQLLSTELFDNASIYVQNPSSMLACVMLAPKPGELILDLAAAPGGKTTMIAAMMQNEGTLSAVEPIKKRFFKLRDNLQRNGVSIAKTYMADGRTIGGKTPNRFDRVLLDAPCSGESRFRAGEEETYRFWSARKIREQSRKQVGLIKSAIRCLKPAGRLLYCTCSFAPEENELAVMKALKRFENVQLETIDLPPEINSQVLLSWEERTFETPVGVRVLPDELHDGFYLCSMRKS